MSVILTNQNYNNDSTTLVVDVRCNIDDEAEVARVCNAAIAEAERLGRGTVVFNVGFGSTAPQSFAVNTLLDALDAELERSQSKAAAQRLRFIVSFTCDGVSDEFIDELDSSLRRPHMVTLSHSFGDSGDPLKSEFKQFSAALPRSKSFIECLCAFIDRLGIKDSEAYKAAGISKSVFSRIRNFDDPKHPHKNTVAAFAIGLRLNIDEAQELYNSAGYYLGYEPTDKIIRFFISKQLYDIDEVNYCLMYYGLPILGEKPRESKPPKH